MLIKFTVENFLSFNQRIEFNMIASHEDHHSHHIVKGKTKTDIDLLRTSLIYGPNESGKSNLIKAMAFAKTLIVEGVAKNKNIDVIPFKLDKSCYQKSSRFEFEFRYQNKQYAYGFVVNKTQVDEEWLFEIGHQLEQPIFERDKNGIRFNFAHHIFANINEREKQRMDFEAESTRENLLFLTNCKERNIKWFNHIYEWFDEGLIILFPTYHLENLPLIKEVETDLLGFSELILDSFGFDIKRIDVEEVEFETLEIPLAIKQSIKKDFPYGKKRARTVLSVNESSYVVQEETGNLIAFKLIILRDDKTGDEIPFELSEESDGTRRIIDFIPMLVSLSKGNAVFVVDEVERSLHVLLIKKLFDFLLNNDLFKNAESQLIASTHEVYLLDIKELFRKDEIWFVNKTKGESQAYSLANAQIEDLDLVKGYINGRFGAIPFIKDVKALGWEK